MSRRNTNFNPVQSYFIWDCPCLLEIHIPLFPSMPTLSQTITSPVHPHHPSALSHSSNSLGLTSPSPTPLASTPALTSANRLDDGSRAFVRQHVNRIMELNPTLRTNVQLQSLILDAFQYLSPLPLRSYLVIMDGLDECHDNLKAIKSRSCSRFDHCCRATCSTCNFINGDRFCH